jgi:hypothetical protein
MDDAAGLIKDKLKESQNTQKQETQAPAGIDLERLAELVVEKLRQELVIENERTGRMM